MIPLCVGLSFRTAPLRLREQLAVVPSRIPEALHRLSRLEQVQEAALLSTCNRVEWYLVADEPAAAASALLRDLARAHALDPATLSAHLTIRPGIQAVRQLFRVAAGLDSAILGESEVVAQVKQAYQSARAVGTAGPILNRLFQKALHVAKEVRTRTRLAEGHASVGAVVASLASRLFGERLSRARVLLWGAGKAAEATAHHLIKAGIRQLWVVNRTQARAQDLASQYQGCLLSWEQAIAHLAQVDIAVVCTQAPHYVIDHAAVDAIAPRRGPRPLCLIDLSVPRNVDPSLSGRPGIQLYNIDDVQGMAQRTLTARRQGLARATTLVEEQVGHFMRWLRSMSPQGHPTCQIVGA